VTDDAGRPSLLEDHSKHNSIAEVVDSSDTARSIQHGDRREFG